MLAYPEKPKKRKPAKYRVSVHWDVSYADLKQLRRVARGWGCSSVAAHMKQLIEQRIGSPVDCAGRFGKSPKAGGTKQ